MATEAIKNVRIFYSYSHRDKELRDDLAKHLGRSYINGWYDREILPGELWSDKIDDNLNNAHIILLLISADFIHSEYCYSREMKRALERHATGEAYVIPIILRPVLWKDQPFSKLQVLPTGGKPITKWLNIDEAFLDVAEGVHKIITAFLKNQYIKEAHSQLENEQYEEALHNYDQIIHFSQITSSLDEDPFIYKDKGDILLHMTQFDKALEAYEKAIQIAPQNAQFYVDKGKVLIHLERFDEALDVYDKTIQMVPDDASLYFSKGDILFHLQHFDDALIAYNDAIRLKPQQAHFYKNKGDTLLYMRRFDDALATYDEAIKLEPQNAEFHMNKGNLLFRNRYYEKALATYDQALVLDPTNAQIWRSKGKALFNIKRFEEAFLSYEEAIKLDSSSSYLFKEKGDILFSLDRLEEAHAAFEDAVRLNPDFGLAYLNIGIVLEKLAAQAYGRLKQRSDQAYEKAKQLGATE